jgi:hypothetical protein
MEADRLAWLRNMLLQVDPTGHSPGLKESLEGRAATTEGLGPVLGAGCAEAAFTVIDPELFALPARAPPGRRARGRTPRDA